MRAGTQTETESLIRLPTCSSVQLELQLATVASISVDRYPCIAAAPQRALEREQGTAAWVRSGRGFGEAPLFPLLRLGRRRNFLDARKCIERTIFVDKVAEQRRSSKLARASMPA